MIRGLGREKGFQTAVAILILIVNFMIVFYAVSTLGEQDSSGTFRFTAKVIPLKYYLYLGLSLAFGGISTLFIRYPEHHSRWGARGLASLLLPAFLLLFTLNMKIFSWDSFWSTVFPGR